MTSILALDLSKVGTGWATGQGGGRPLCRSLGFNGVHRGAVLAQYLAWLRDRLLTTNPDLVAYEAPIMTAKAKGSTNTLFLLIGLAAITETICSMKATPVVSVGSSSWRLAFLGEGFPEDPKARAVAMCRELGWPVQSEDEADACGVWAWSHLKHGDRDEMRDQLSRAKMREMEG